MAIVEVKMPTGWIPVQETLTSQVELQQVQKVEVEKNYVELYFNQFTSERSCVTFEVEQDIKMSTKPALVTVYDYYETSDKVTVEYGIKTTCGTKEEIPLDNEGLDCSIMQCRVTDTIPPQMQTCPSCPENELSATEIEDLICGSTAVYKATVGRKGTYPIKIKADLKPKKKVALDMFVTSKMGDQCSCPILQSSTESRAFIFTKGEAINTEAWEIKLQEGDSVISGTSILERTIRRIASRGKLCEKLARLRRSQSTKNARRKLLKLHKKLGLV